MARIKHMAVKTADVPKLADFYKNVFGLKEVSRGKRSIYLSDGYINMAILPAEGGPEGIDHFGFEVEDPQKMADPRSKPAPGRGRAICRAMADSPRCLLKIPRGNGSIFRSRVGRPESF